MNDVAALETFCRNHGASLFGTCSISHLKDTFLLNPGELEGLTHAISIGVRLSRAVLNGIEDSPTLLYKWHYRQANVQLDKIAFLLSLKLQELGFLALPIAASQTVDWQKQAGHLSHKRVAIEAGLGWLGRNNLVVNQEFGSQFRLVTVLTNMPLKQPEQQPFRCGDCYRCLAACPAKALGETPEQYQFQKCFQLLSHFCKNKNLGLYICGICVKACPGKLSNAD
ncbi:MAG: hypothetical protein ONB05_02090 [candidate division KSB1 bacterium]|nr:hypothetical protein [candidate division KSB1 bacterium]